ncbi:hypothetical protein [Burkholderia ubonensis]|uniref:hypothetical protein n=1 Tax=Burkholderia ubonensis TaxID=101571 RepID=UPI000B0E5CFE|nr:hypothetical protein [Burkholderia ubonensis]
MNSHDEPTAKPRRTILAAWKNEAASRSGEPIAIDSIDADETRDATTRSNR